MAAGRYRVLWICSDNAQEQITEVTALHPQLAARTVTGILEVLENRTDVMITGVTAL